MTSAPAGTRGTIDVAEQTPYRGVAGARIHSECHSSHGSRPGEARISGQGPTAAKQGGRARDGPRARIGGCVPDTRDSDGSDLAWNDARWQGRPAQRLVAQSGRPP